MPADPLLLTAGQWLGIAGGGLAVLTVLGFVARWGIRFRLVGVTSFTVLLSLSCLAFAISYSPRAQVVGALSVPVVYDNGTDLVIAAAAAGMEPESFRPSVEQVALNLRGSGRKTDDDLVHVRLRRVEPAGAGMDRPVILAEAIRDLRDGSVTLMP